MIASPLTPESLLLAAIEPQAKIIKAETDRQLSGIMATIEEDWKDGKLPTPECVLELVATLQAEALALRSLYSAHGPVAVALETAQKRIGDLADTHAKVKAGDLTAGQEVIREAKERCRPKNPIMLGFTPWPGDGAFMLAQVLNDYENSASRSALFMVGIDHGRQPEKPSLFKSLVGKAVREAFSEERMVSGWKTEEKDSGAVVVTFYPKAKT